MVLATSADLIGDVKMAREDALSHWESLREVSTGHRPGLDTNSTQQGQRLVMDHTLPFLNNEDMYQNDVIRTKLTRNIAATFLEVQDELIEALSELIPASTDGM
jgi:hypothetical protein